MKLMCTSSKFFVLLFLSLALVGCSDELTRSKAKQLIIEEYGYPNQRRYKLSINNQYSENFYYKLQQKGLLTYTLHGSNMNRSITTSFTEKGKQYVLSEPYIDITAPFVDVSIGVETFGEITGIKTTGETSAVVEYTASFGEITPFGEVLKSEPETYSCKATFNKYDDGWRVEKIVRKK